MRVCPNCGHENDETAAICARCNQELPPPALQSPMQLIRSGGSDFSESVSATPAPQAPVQLPTAPAQDDRRKKRQYLQGLGLGLIPLFIFLLATGVAVPAQGSYGSSRLSAAATLLIISLGAYIAFLIATIACLSIRQDRFVGYGLLTAVLASPVIGAIACVASFNIH